MTAQDDSRLERAAETAPGAVFRSLAELVYTSDDYPRMYQALCDAAVQLVDGCDHASLMVEQGKHLTSAAASDDIALHVDQLELEIGEGPCVDAIHEDVAQLDADILTDSTWPQLRDRVVTETPVRSMAAFRILMDGRKVGALNLFGDRPGGLDAASIDQAAVLAAFASVALVAAARDEQARTLREGLASNREIGKAVGLMMAFHKVGDDQAFDILRTASQEMNLKLSEIARQVVDHHNQRP